MKTIKHCHIDRDKFNRSFHDMLFCKIDNYYKTHHRELIISNLIVEDTYK